MRRDRLHAHDVAVVAGEVQAVDLPHGFRFHRIELEPALVSAPVADRVGRRRPEAKGRHGPVPVPLAGVLLIARWVCFAFSLLWYSSNRLKSLLAISPAASSPVCWVIETILTPTFFSTRS